MGGMGNVDFIFPFLMFLSHYLIGWDSLLVMEVDYWDVSKR